MRVLLYRRIRVRGMCVCVCVCTEDMTAGVRVLVCTGVWLEEWTFKDVSMYVFCLRARCHCECEWTQVWTRLSVGRCTQAEVHTSMWRDEKASVWVRSALREYVYE